MEDSILQRFNKVIYEKDISITSLSKKIGIPQVTLNNQVRGERALSVSTLSAFLSFFTDISAEWLLRGEGSMIKGEPQQQCISHVRIVGEIEMDENNRLIFKMK